MKAVIIIPARLGSTRLAHKLLLDLAGKPVIQRTYEQTRKAARAARVLVATDAKEIADIVEKFGGEAVMTRADHQSGSERIAEAAQGLDADMIVNIQGDEPEIDPAHIDALIDTHARVKAFASTLACPFPADAVLTDPSRVKAIVGAPVVGADGCYDAKDFTRKAGAPPHYLHVGAYAYSPLSLSRFAAAKPSPRERAERLEQLRILEMGEQIAVRIVDRAAPGIDTLADLDAARKRMSASA